MTQILNKENRANTINVYGILAMQFWLTIMPLIPLS